MSKIKVKCYWRSKNGAGNSIIISSKTNLKKWFNNRWKNREESRAVVNGDIIGRVWKSNKWNCYIEDEYIGE